MKKDKPRNLLLKQAHTLLNGERHDDYGEALDNHKRIATIWSVILNRTISPEEVAACMMGVKLARLSNTMYKEDTWVDIIGYGALGGEFIQQHKK